MTNRTEGFWRLLGGFIYLPLAVLFLSFFILILAGYALIDVVWQMLTNDEGLPGSMDSNVIVAIWDNIRSNVEWVFLGRGDFELLP